MQSGSAKPTQGEVIDKYNDTLGRYICKRCNEGDKFEGKAGGSDDDARERQCRRRSAEKMNWGACYFDHYERNFPNRLVGREVYALPVIDGHLQILTFDGSFSDARVFATVGASRAPGPAAELVFISSSEWETLPDILAACLEGLITESGCLKYAQLVAGIDELDREFCARTGKTHLYITVPHSLPNSFFEVQCGEKTGNVFQGILLTNEEADYLRKKGSDALEAQMEANNIDLHNPARPAMTFR